MIKTVEQYLESLNDGREVWCLGEKVADVRTHPTISTIIRTASMDYVLPNHPDYRELFVTQDKAIPEALARSTNSFVTFANGWTGPEAFLNGSSHAARFD